MAISVLTIGFLGVVTLLSKALGLNRVVADNYIGTYLAAEGIEVAKNILDTNLIQKTSWSQGFSDGDYEVDYQSTALQPYQDRTLSFDGGTGHYAYQEGYTPTSYKRKVTVKLIADAGVQVNEIQVNSEVSWITRGGGTFSINLEDHFFNWRQ